MIELKWFQLQRVTKGLPSSARITECCDLSEPCQSMVSSQVQRRLRRPGYRFYWGWAPVVGDEKGIPGRIEYFLNGNLDLKFDNLGITRKVKKKGCMHCLQQRNQNEFKESVFFQCSCHTSGLVTGDRANQTSHGICGDDAGALSPAQGGRWMIVLQCSLTQNSCSNVEGMALQPRLVIQSQKELIIRTTKEVWSVCGVT